MSKVDQSLKDLEENMEKMIEKVLKEEEGEGEDKKDSILDQDSFKEFKEETDKHFEVMRKKIFLNEEKIMNQNERVGDIDTKVLVLLHATKNIQEGKDTKEIFDGMGDIISVLENLKT